MKPVWQPGIPLRFRTSDDGKKILQQVWCQWVLGPECWHQTKEYEWRDVPINIEDPLYWCQEESI